MQHFPTTNLQIGTLVTVDKPNLSMYTFRIISDMGSRVQIGFGKRGQYFDTVDKSTIKVYQENS